MRRSRAQNTSHDRPTEASDVFDHVSLSHNSCAYREQTGHQYVQQPGRGRVAVERSVERSVERGSSEGRAKVERWAKAFRVWKGGPDPAFPLLFHENPESRTFFHSFPESRFFFPKNTLRRLISTKANKCKVQIGPCD